MADDGRIDKHRLADRFEIQDVIYRWCRALDRRDWNAIRPLFHSDAIDDHGFYSGNIDGLVECLIKRHATMVQCQHGVANMLIEFAGPEQALVESYVYASQRHLVEGPAIESGKDHLAFDFLGFGRYVDRFERRNGHWKILNRIVVFEAGIKYNADADPNNGQLSQNQNKASRDGRDVVELERLAMKIFAPSDGESSPIP